ncbi:glycosyltransferase family 87 protein [Propylenella binzhouense]|nr:glycosyltransferase family 87 protein [Propylenella binzhouense]
MRRHRTVLEGLRSGDWISPARIRGYSILLLAMFAVALLALWTTGHGLLDAWGRPIGTDFADPYSAGRMALDGRAGAIHDYSTHYAEQRILFGGGDDQPFYAWSYPPIFLLFATPFALLPYMPALVAWLAATFALYLAAIRTILPQRLAFLAASAFPAVFVTVSHGHNAFLTAGLLGLGLAKLERNPWLAGLLLGCLAYKPHLGLVLPLVLAAGGHWKAFCGAAVSVVGLSALSVAAFGLEPWYAFFASGDDTRRFILEELSTGWFKIQSVFSAVRGLGGPLALAYGAQALVSAAVLGALAWVWFLGSGRYAKAAACTGALLVTPYVLDYDMAVLGPALAFLAARGLARGFRPYEKSLMLAAWVVPLLARPVAQHLDLPIGLIVMAALFVFSVRGALTEEAARAAEPHRVRREAGAATGRGEAGRATGLSLARRARP